jgi:hypothetical protein
MTWPPRVFSAHFIVMRPCFRVAGAGLRAGFGPSQPALYLRGAAKSGADAVVLTVGASNNPRKFDLVIDMKTAGDVGDALSVFVVYVRIQGKKDVRDVTFVTAVIPDALP